MRKTKFTLDRRTFIGASEIGAIVLPNKWNTPHQLWLEKTGRMEREETYAMRMGRHMEAFVMAELKAQAKRQGFDIRKIVRNRVTYRHPKFAFAAATPDGFGLYKGEPCILETKYCNDYIAEQFGDPGSDQCPDAYVCQVVWQMLCCQVKHGFLGVSLSNRGCAVYHFDASDGEAGQALRDLMRTELSKAGAFWKQYVEADMPPPLTGYEPDSRFVKQTYSYDDGSMVAADEEITERCKAYLQACKDEEEAALRKAEAANTIKPYMGDASVLETTLGNFTWKADKNGQRSFRKPRRIEEVAA